MNILLFQKLDKIEIRVKKIVEAIYETFGDVVTFQVQTRFFRLTISQQIGLCANPYFMALKELRGFYSHFSTKNLTKS